MEWHMERKFGWYCACLFLAIGSRLRNFARRCSLLFHVLDDTDGHRLRHITHGETTQRWIFRELLQQFSKLARNVGRVAVEHRCIASTDLTMMVQDDDLYKHKQEWRLPLRGRATKLAASRVGSFLMSEARKPRRNSFTVIFFPLKPTLSPGTASATAAH